MIKRSFNEITPLVGEGPQQYFTPLRHTFYVNRSSGARQRCTGNSNEEAHGKGDQI